jgi:diacylglycerol O-acyltransferase
MEQLSGMDSAFLYMETAKTPMHIGGIAIYDPSTAPNGFVRFKDILKFIEERLHLAKSFRRKVVTPPLNMDYPYWVEDSDFDLEYHVRHIALPQPGDWRQLCIQAARLHSRMLDLKKPLWEFTVVEGLNKIPGVPKGSYAIISKIHHAAIDGVSGVDIATALHSPSPENVVTPPEKPWVPERTPSSVELIARAQLNTVALPFRFGRQVAKTLPGLARLIQGVARGTLRSGFGGVPRTRFNGSVGSHRVVGGCDFDLATMKEMRLKIPGATVNDVVVAIVGGAMRQYLKGKSELPSESMVAMAPISVRSAGERNTLGNQVSAMTIPIGTHIADPIARLSFVHDEAENSKALTKAVGARELSDYSKFTPSMLTGLAARLYVGLGLANRVAPMFNTVITNIPGPPVPLYMNGARLVTQYGLGPVFEGMGIIHPVFSNFGRITISFTSDRDIMPDPEHYQECIQESFEEMRAATLGKPRERTSGEPKKRSRKKKVALATVDGTKVGDAA